MRGAPLSCRIDTTRRTGMQHGIQARLGPLVLAVAPAETIAVDRDA
jgi:hypothetical protein